MWLLVAMVTATHYSAVPSLWHTDAVLICFYGPEQTLSVMDSRLHLFHNMPLFAHCLPWLSISQPNDQLQAHHKQLEPLSCLEWPVGSCNHRHSTNNLTTNKYRLSTTVSSKLIHFQDIWPENHRKLMQVSHPYWIVSKCKENGRKQSNITKLIACAVVYDKHKC